MRTAIAIALLALLAAGCGEEPADESYGGPENPEPTAAEPFPEGTYEVGCIGCIFEDPDATACRTVVKVGDEFHGVVGDDVPPEREMAFCRGSKSVVIAGEVKDGVIHAAKFEVVESGD